MTALALDRSTLLHRSGAIARRVAIEIPGAWEPGLRRIAARELQNNPDATDGQVVDYLYMMDAYDPRSRFCWVDRAGRRHQCSWAGHDRVANAWFEQGSWGAECAGWARVSDAVRFTHRLNGTQVREIGRLLDWISETLGLHVRFAADENVGRPLPTLDEPTALLEARRE